MDFREGQETLAVAAIFDKGSDGSTRVTLAR
jgi:hypothetical protein